MEILRAGSVGDGVRALQVDLIALELTAQVRPSGLFSRDTTRAVRRYQAEAGLGVDGVVGPITRAALRADVAASVRPEFKRWRGRLGFLSAWEEHAGRPYWPGGYSGLTLDPGFDLGQNDEASLVALYGDELGAAGIDALRPAVGVRGWRAEPLAQVPAIRALRTDRALAAQRLPLIAAPRWLDLLHRLPALTARGVPAAAHTVLLDLVYNCGPRRLEALRAGVEAGAWSAVAQALAVMDLAQPGLGRRRRAEATLLRIGTGAAPYT